MKANYIVRKKEPSVGLSISTPRTTIIMLRGNVETWKGFETEQDAHRWGKEECEKVDYYYNSFIYS